MYSYQFVSDDVFKLFSAGNLNHREIIQQYAAQGYRYVGPIPTSYLGALPAAFDLIFEKKEDATD